MECSLGVAAWGAMGVTNIHLLRSTTGSVSCYFGTLACYNSY
jgi:hypothetical protein